MSFLPELERLAHQHAAAGLSPVVSLVVHNKVVVATTPLTPRSRPVDHGELRALQAAPRGVGVLYTSVQPCLMCYGAARIMGIETIAFVLPAPDGIHDSTVELLLAHDAHSPRLVQVGPADPFLSVFRTARGTYPQTVVTWNEERETQ